MEKLNRLKPLKNFYESHNKGEFNPTPDYLFGVSFLDKRVKNFSNPIEMRVDDVDLSNVILGYQSEVIGNESYGFPPYQTVLKNGLNYENFTMTIEENSNSDVLAYLTEKLRNMVNTYGSHSTYLDGAVVDIEESPVKLIEHLYLIPEVQINMYTYASSNVDLEKQVPFRTIHFVNCAVMSIDIPQFSVDDDGTVKYTISLNPRYVRITETIKSVREVTFDDKNRHGGKFHNTFYKNYDAPLLGNLWIAEFDNINPMYIQEMSMRIHPDIQMGYIGNPSFGRPPRVPIIQNNFIGELEVTFLDDNKNDNINELISMFGSYKSSADASYDKRTWFNFNVTRFVYAKQTERIELSPTVQFKVSHCKILDINLGSKSKSSNDFGKITVNIHIGGITVKRETKYNYLGKATGGYSIDFKKDNVLDSKAVDSPDKKSKPV